MRNSTICEETNTWMKSSKKKAEQTRGFMGSQCRLPFWYVELRFLNHRLESISVTYMIWPDLPVLCDTTKRCRGEFWRRKPSESQAQWLLSPLRKKEQWTPGMFPLLRLPFFILQWQNVSEQSLQIATLLSVFQTPPHHRHTRITALAHASSPSAFHIGSNVHFRLIIHCKFKDQTILLTY